jgi:D-alanyl-D-alanine carboxypeptidase
MANNKKKKANKKVKFRKESLIAYAVIGAILLLFILLIGKSCSNSKKETPAVPEQTTQNSENTTSAVPSPNEPIIGTMETIVKNAEDVHKGNLILVNNDHQYVGEHYFGDNSKFDLLPVIENGGKYVHATDNTKFLYQDAISGWSKLTEQYVKKYNDDNLYILTTCDANSDRTRDYITGLSFRIQYGSGVSGNSEIYQYNTDPNIRSTKNYMWVTENAAYFGFITRYPLNSMPDKLLALGVSQSELKDDLFRFVGIPHAYYMYTNSKVLEEYIPEIKTHDKNHPLIIDFPGNTEYGIPATQYSVYYVLADEIETTIEYTSDLVCEVSGDNVDGFIVTTYKKTVE